MLNVMTSVGVLIFLFCSLNGCVQKNNQTSHKEFMMYTDVPPLDLRRDELPYLRMGKAFGNLTFYAQSDANTVNSHEGKKDGAMKERWDKFAMLMQKKYPLKLLKADFLETRWFGVGVPDIKARACISWDPKVSSYDVKIVFKVQGDDEGKMPCLSSIQKKLCEHIVSIDRSMFVSGLRKQ